MVVCLSLAMPPALAQVPADCAPVRAAIASRVHTEYGRVDAVPTSVSSDVARSRSCVDAVLDGINQMIPSFGGNSLIGGLLQSLASQGCQLIQSTTTATGAVVRDVTGIRGDVGGSVGLPPGLSGGLGEATNVGSGGARPGVVTTPPEQPQRSVWDRLSSIW